MGGWIFKTMYNITLDLYVSKRTNKFILFVNVIDLATCATFIALANPPHNNNIATCNYVSLLL